MFTVKARMDAASSGDIDAAFLKAIADNKYRAESCVAVITPLTYVKMGVKKTGGLHTIVSPRLPGTGTCTATCVIINLARLEAIEIVVDDHQSEGAGGTQ